MAKMQPMSFDSVDEFLEYLPESELKIVQTLRELILECIPECREKLSYNVPYYFRNARICFIWPSAIPWGMVPLEGVKLGFVQGHLLTDDLQYLEKGNRKQVYTKTFFSVDEIDREILRTYLFEAILLDDQKKKKSLR